MSRIPLKQGDRVVSPKEQYIIQSVIGDGATGIVYDAIYYDSMGQSHTIRLKECYPFAAKVTRVETELHWENEQEKERNFNNFTAAYYKLMKRQNSNFAVRVFDLFETNGTTYIVMDANDGVTFDKDNAASLGEILKTVKLLAYVVGEYHKNGYLHLDIKPSNFLVYTRPSEHIVLFDIDSVTAIADIRDGNVQAVSYSKGWAAPEQMQGRLDKIGPATDIFAIGAVLFEKIMGRAVENSDIGIFAHWDMEGPLFEKVNPKIKRILRGIFQKTLSANIKRRYQTIEELLSSIDEAIYVCREGAPYIISDFPLSNKNFIGREKELLAIHQGLEEGNRAIFLHGFGGIGKSELAKKYAEIHAKEYDAILFLTYRNNIKETLFNVEIQNCTIEKDKHIDDFYKTIKRVLNEQQVLLIVDNFDVEFDENLEDILSFGADIIFTSRTDFKDFAFGGTAQIDINSLTENELMTLFQKESGYMLQGADDTTLLKKILKLIQYHTLFVPLIAKYMVAAGNDLVVLYNKVKVGLQEFEETEKIYFSKDKKLYKNTVLDILRVVFRVVELSPIQKEVLANIYSLRGFEINKGRYKQYLLDDKSKELSHINAINDLIKLGWIQKQDKDEWGYYVSDPILCLHPLVQEMISVDIQSDISQNEMIRKYIETYLPWDKLIKAHYGFDERYDESVDIDSWSTLEKDIILEKFNWLFAFLCTLDFSDEKNLIFVAELMTRTIDGDIEIYRFFSENYYFKWKCIEGIERALQNINIENPTIIFMFANILQVKYTMTFGYVDKQYWEIQKAEHYFGLAESIVEKVDETFKTSAIWLLCKPIVFMIDQHSIMENDGRIAQRIYNIVKSYEPIWSTECGDIGQDWWEWDKWSDDYKKHQEELSRKYSTKLEDDEEWQEEMEDRHFLWDKIAYYSERYFSGISLDVLNGELLSDDELTNYGKNRIYLGIIEKECHQILHPWGDLMVVFQNIQEKNWNRALELLTHQEEFYKKYLDSNSEQTNIEADLYRAVLYAVIEDKQTSSHYLNNLMYAFKTFIGNNQDSLRLYDFMNFDEIGELKGAALYPAGGMIFQCLDMLCTCERYYIALPYLIECSKIINECFMSLLDYEEGMMYSWYKIIADCASGASIWMNITSEESKRYQAIEDEYQSKADALLEAKENITYFKLRNNSIEADDEE